MYPNFEPYQHCSLDPPQSRTYRLWRLRIGSLLLLATIFAMGLLFGPVESASAQVGVPIELGIDKVVSSPIVAPGGMLEYEIILVNGSNVPAEDILMLDPIPVGTTYVAGSANASAPTVGYDAGNNRIQWQGTIPANDSVLIKFSVDVDEQIECGSDIINTAAARAPFLEEAMEAQARTVVDCSQEPVLDIVKRASTASTVAGGTIGYEITIYNGGDAPAPGVNMVDPIPAGTMYVAGSVAATSPNAAFDNANNRVVWNGTIPAHGSVTIKFEVEVKKSADCDSVVINKASARWGNQVVDSSVRTLIECPPEPELTISKSADVANVAPGGLIEYTIEIANSGAAPAIGITMLDPIPGGTSYVAGSAAATAPAVVYDAGNNWIKWGGNIPAGGSVIIKFKVKVSDEVECQSTIYNRAAIVRPSDLSIIEQAIAQVRVDCHPQDLYMDFGDAPDSTFNHHNLDNTAYPAAGTLGRFPTVWEGTPPGQPSGPAHQVLYWYWLGELETREKDADLLPDGDGVTNILDNGAADVADRDRGDDGWLNPDVAFNDCKTTKLRVRVARSGAAPTLEQLYLNVWYDGNRDGDWNDLGKCPEEKQSFEWIVQNHVVNAAAIPVGGFVDIDVPTVLVHRTPSTDQRVNTNWIRFTLSERPAVEVASGALPDGRGPSYPGRFRLGETEDYIQKHDVPGEPELHIRKRADVSRVLPGGTIEYTIEVQNSGNAAAMGVTVLDPIPPGTTYVAGSAASSAPTVVYDAGNNWIKWGGNIPAGGSVTIKFKVEVSKEIDCGATIKNVAYIVLETGEYMPSEGVLVDVECDPKEPQMDFGDAPHSRSNHHGMDNTAYAGVLGRFPTVWETTPATAPSGPAHERADIYWLGNRVSTEVDADIMPDSDGMTNILDNGTADVADRDRGDDGWLNSSVPLNDCRRSTLLVRVSRANFPANVEKLYLNVWFDGNRDGDWQDAAACQLADDLLARSYEWIVQDWTVNAAAIPVGGFVDIQVPTVRIHNIKPEADAWMRFSLTERPAIRPASGGLADGRGMQHPASFKIGETEDYLRPGKNQGEPGKISIDKTATTTSSPVALGNVIGYSVYLSHSGGTAPATTVMTDVLPAEVVLVAPPVVTELTPAAAPLYATFDPSIGPNGAVLWNGQLSPGASIRIDFKVRVRYCLGEDLIKNVAKALQTDGSTILATKDLKFKCENPKPEIKLEKKILLRGEDGERELTESAFLNSSDLLGFVLRLSSGDNMTHTVAVEDDLPAGLIAVGANASSGVVNVVNGGHTIHWTGELGPNNSPVIIRIRVRLTHEVKCDERMINVATWKTRTGHNGESNKVTLWLACSDLGDAPDSTNHAGTGMTAYPGIKGQYPTVFDVAAPERGPMHLRPRPFFLGRGVSAEIEADQGFDMDGVNNLRVPADVADLDRYDDGLAAKPSFAHCRLNRMQIRVNISPAAAAFFANADGKGYLNAWVDSNRDGDWADELDCPPVAGTRFSSALEHIVIDYAVDVAALGPGLHTIVVPTTGPVYFPATDEQPAWLRLTLSERPSNKPLKSSGGAHPANYGDGRGYDVPFRLGETEDYLIPGPTKPDKADMTVRKRGSIRSQWDRVAQMRRYIVTWIVEYENAGSAPASNATLMDEFSSEQSFLSEATNPPKVANVAGNTVSYNLGNVGSGAGGIAVIRTTVPYSIAPGTVLTNKATVAADNDSDAGNNVANASVTVPLLPPVITYPLAGTTCKGDLTVTGKAQAGVEVDVYIDGTLVGTAMTNADGDWSLAVVVADGNHSVYAIAKFGGNSSAPSPSVLFTVDSGLFWNPMSLRFQRPDGTIIRPNGRLDESGWRIFLRPGVVYKVMLEICCGDPNAQVVLELGDQQIDLTDPDGDGTYEATFTAPPRGSVNGRIRICVLCDLIRKCSDGQVLIDPEGTVYDALTGKEIADATVACFQETDASNATFDLWNAAEFGQVNPQTTGSDGYYSFFTPAGTYQVEVVKDGYQTHRSPDLVVTDSPVHYDVQLMPVVSEEADYVISVTDSGFVPSILTVEPGSTIQWVNVGENAHSTTRDSAQAAGASSAVGGWDSGLLNSGDSFKQTLTAAGTYTYTDTENPDFEATVVIGSGPTIPQRAIFLPLVAK